MFSKAFTVAAAAMALLPSASAIYDPLKKTNLVMYWGQGPDQLPLKAFCTNTPADIIVIGFINTFPSAANGYVGANFGNGCWGPEYNYAAPGYNGAKPVPANNLLPSRCPVVQEGIPICQKAGKKILLSLGGDPGTKSYRGQLKSAADGTYFADFLWKAYGPKDPSYTGVRPLDRGINNNDASIAIDIDGFDFDIEASVASTDANNGETAGYIAMITRLRTLMNAQTAKTGKKYILSGAPQCPLINGVETNMDAMIQKAGFDIVFIQFYNNGYCTARSRVNKNPKDNFNYAAWLAYLNKSGSKSFGARIYIGLLGGPSGSSSNPGDFLNVAEVQNLIATYGKNPQIGGVMLWDGTAASKYRGADLSPSTQRYWDVVKTAMLKNFPGQTKRDLEIDGAVADVEVLDKREDVHVEHVQQARRHAHMARHQHHA